MIDAAIAVLQAELQPVPRDREQRANWQAAMDERLRRLAVKISPAMLPEQGDIWRDVMVDALSDLPAMVALTAAKLALHKPMQFMNEVDTVVRAIAAEIVEGRRNAISRLERLRDEIARAKAPRPALTDDRDRPFEDEEIRRMSPVYRRMGLSCGFITQEQVDRAFGGAPPDDELGMDDQSIGASVARTARGGDMVQ